MLTEEEATVAALHYDINEVGEMHHNPAKNVLYVRAPVDEIARRMNLAPEKVSGIAELGETKMYAARLKRQTPYVDKTVYVGWNSLCVSAYLEAARVLEFAGRAAVCLALSGSRAHSTPGTAAQARLRHTAARAGVLGSEGGASRSCRECSRITRSPRWLASTHTRRPRT